MSKKLKKKSRNLILLKIKIKNFIIQQLWVHIIVIGSIILVSWLFDRWLQGLMVCIAHTCIRNAFDKQFHFDKTAYCLLLTLSIIWFSIPITLPTAESLLSSIPIAFLICFFGYVVQDRVDAKKENSALERTITSLISELKLYKQVDLYSMTEEELKQYGASQQLSNTQIEILCLRVLENLSIADICRQANYGRTTIKYHLEQIKKKLGIITL